jgi:predicted acetyltransferase
MAAAAKKSPTNADLANEIRDVKKMVAPLVQDVQVLKDWKLQQDAYKDALASIKEEEKQSASEKEVVARTEVWVKAGKVLGLIAVLLTAYLAGRGIQ